MAFLFQDLYVLQAPTRIVDSYVLERIQELQIQKLKCQNKKYRVLDRAYGKI